MIKLYGPARAPYTEKVRRALLYKGLDFEFHEPTSVDDYKRWNPENGMLPLVEIGEERISDSTAILFALDRLYPDPPLLSADPTVASQQRQLEEWADESFLWYFLKYRRMLGEGAPVLVADGSTAAAATPASSADADAAAVDPESGRLRRIAAWLRAGGTWERPVTGLLREVGLRMDDLVNFLGGRPFFYSEQLSLADLGVYSMLFTMRNDSIPGASRLLAQRPSLVAFMGRVEDATRGKTEAP